MHYTPLCNYTKQVFSIFCPYCGRNECDRVSALVAFNARYGGGVLLCVMCCVHAAGTENLSKTLLVVGVVEDLPVVGVVVRGGRYGP